MDIKNNRLVGEGIKHLKSPNTSGNISELWKEIRGYEGMYEVSSFGRVRCVGYYYQQIGKGGVVCNRFCKPKIRKTSIKNNGYVTVYLTVDRKERGVSPHLHRLVAEAFITNPDNLPSVNHKDGNKLNNKVDNLEWSSFNDNQFHQRRTLKKAYETDILDRDTGIFYLSMAECFESIGSTLQMNYRNFRSSLNPSYKGYNQPTPTKLRERFVKLYKYKRNGSKESSAI